MQIMSMVKVSPFITHDIISVMRMEGKPQEVSISDEHFEKAKNKAETAYKALSAIPCPYLKEDVHFNARGLEHLKFKARDRARNRFDQYARFKLVHLVPEIIRRSATVQGVWETNVWESQKSHGRWEKRQRAVVYYEFIAVIGKARLKVIVKKSESSPPHFWSLIPFWKMNEITRERKLYDGDPESD